MPRGSPPSDGASSSSVSLAGWAGIWVGVLVLAMVGLGCVFFRRRRRRGARQAVAHHPPALLPAVAPAALLTGPSEGSEVVIDVDAPAAGSPETLLSIEEVLAREKELSEERLFQLKRDWLLREITARAAKQDVGPERRAIIGKNGKKVLPITVSRERVFQDSYAQFAWVTDADLKLPVSVHFQNEAGRDEGGVTRDWYSVLSRQMFNEDYGLFTASASDDGTFQVNPNSGVNPDHLDFFRFVGTIAGKAVADGCLLGVHFTRLFYKRVLGRPVTYHDMASHDVQFYKSLCWVIENDLSEQDLGLTFSVEREAFGAYEEVELKPGGQDMPVTQDNKREYVDLLAEWRLKDSVEPQMAALRGGLSRVVALELLHPFDECELEWLVGGLPHLDLGDWRAHTVYKAGYTDQVAIIIWFWQLVESWDEAMRARLLQFVTGTSKVPYPEGFAGLRGSDGLRAFHIVRVSDITRLPQAHTCYNELLLPDYDTFEDLKRSLVTAIFETGNQFLLR
ncbi:Putative ubiquitin protein ligase [Klebsormidium nitens]|uniref:HECT-type E3 ubiquitin transferase n=1 Tax=Klebsormidium nitens TaxID=105231 RepID=A0A1Y1HZZ2_KLENI|nr:Putative ubiquitin protein ligase [Klebsormidium nitens]|eukprot:GAQ83753.1 Putative ubiquitin protein ligase [Klebsormidium nitens]